MLLRSCGVTERRRRRKRRDPATRVKVRARVAGGSDSADERMAGILDDLARAVGGDCKLEERGGRRGRGARRRVFEPNSETALFRTLYGALATCTAVRCTLDSYLRDTSLSLSTSDFQLASSPSSLLRFPLALSASSGSAPFVHSFDKRNRSRARREDREEAAGSDPAA